MPITDRQRRKHNELLGSSDMAALFGYDRYKTEADVQLIKLGKVEPQAPTDAMRAGNLYEPAYLAYAEQVFGKLRRNVEKRAPGGLPLRVHVDGCLLDGSADIEAKRVRNRDEEGDYGEPGSGDVPARVMVQVQTIMLCTGHPLCYVVVDLPFSTLPAIYKVSANAQMQQAIAVMAKDFWAHHIVGGEPVLARPSYDILPYIIRETGKRTAVDPEMVKRYVEMGDEIKKVTDARKALQSEVVADMGDAEYGDGGDIAVSYRHEARKGYVVESSNPRVFRVLKQGLKGDNDNE